MAIKQYKPTTNGRREMTCLTYEEITTSKPEKSLLAHLSHKGGRNAQGLITVRHKGTCERRHYRLIDFKRNKDGVKATVKTIEYDPNRTANIALVAYADGAKSYIIAPQDLKVGQVIESGTNVDIKIGNTMPIVNIPVGTTIHNIELHPGHGAQLIRSAGSSAQILGREEDYVLVRLCSGEVRRILNDCRATIGVVGNIDYALVNIGKAGRARHMGIHPTVRGSAMNPNDHPHGGGEGKCPIGRKAPLTPWGKRTMGVKTRDSKKSSNKLIVRRRNG